jgi:serine/threonine protein kinase
VNDPTGQTVCKLCDFGIASKIDGSATGNDRTRTGAIGSPVYMAPEMSTGQYGRAHYDHRVDVYSFGILLWVMWHGRRDPYEHIQALGSFELMRMIADGNRPVFEMPLRSAAASVSVSPRISSGALADDHDHDVSSLKSASVPAAVQSESGGDEDGSSRSSSFAHSSSSSSTTAMTTKRHWGGDAEQDSHAVFASASVGASASAGERDSEAGGGGDAKERAGDLSLVSSTGALHGFGAQPVHKVAELAARCWAHEPSDRLSLEDVIRELDGIPLGNSK